MENSKSNEQSSEMSSSEVLGEQGSVLPERKLMRHRRRKSIVSLGGVVSADNGSAANSNTTIQIGGNNTNTNTQTATDVNIL